MNTSKSPEIRTRFAPSPTGFLHVGGARTALFNLLFARKYRGKFSLRIEDTDATRSTEINVQQIINDLQWLGINWDEEIVFQSKQISIFQDYARHLIETKHAYYCFCTPEELEAKRKQGDKTNRTYIYDGTCRRLSSQEVKSKLKKNLPYAIRFKMPAGTTSWIDGVHEKVEINNNELDDFILLRSDSSPTYQLAVVVDDHTMNITHVIRGDDHIPNTPKQILLYKAFGWQIPDFVHVPLILGPDGTRLSKRHGATSVGEFREKGFLPEALLNYLSLLGWSPGDDSEIMSFSEIKGKFTLKGVSKKGAIFDEAKLVWMNAHYIREMPDDRILTYMQNYLYSNKIKANKNFDEKYLTNVIRLMKNRAKVLSDFIESANYFYEDPKKFDDKGVNNYFKKADIWICLAEFTEKLAKSSEYDEFSIENLLRQFAVEKNIAAAKIIHPVRLALTGKTASPGLFEMMNILGKETVLRRLKFFLTQKERLTQLSKSGRTKEKY